MNKKEARVRRARKTRARIADAACDPAGGQPLQLPYLCADHRAGRRQGAGQRLDARGARCARTSRTAATKAAATLVGKRIAEKAKALGIETVAFDRSGYQYHGRVKALAEAAREAGLKF